MRTSRKPLATIKQDETGQYRIYTDGQAWVDSFDTEEEADTYALRNGCQVEGC